MPRRAGAAAGAQVIQGLDWVRQNYEAPATVVMALGGEAQYALDLAVHDLARAGVSVLVAAGNEDTDACTKSPARRGPLPAPTRRWRAPVPAPLGFFVLAEFCSVGMCQCTECECCL